MPPQVPAPSCFLSSSSPRWLPHRRKPPNRSDIPSTNLHAGEQIVRTTPGHPFYVQDKGWVKARNIEAGDLLWTKDGTWVASGGVADSGEFQRVYNFRVAEYHTYFVASQVGKPWLWSHNVTCLIDNMTLEEINAELARRHAEGDAGLGTRALEYEAYSRAEQAAGREPKSVREWYQETHPAEFAELLKNRPQMEPSQIAIADFNRPTYRRGHAGKPVVDHILSRAIAESQGRLAEALSHSNEHIKPWEWNSRKGAFEGEFLRERNRLINEEGFSEIQADFILEESLSWIMNDVMGRRTNPLLFRRVVDPRSGAL